MDNTPNDTTKINPTGLDFYTAFEPKMQNRFIVYVKDKDGEEVIPAYLLKRVDRPSCSRWYDALKNENLWKWNPINIEAYDPITPSGSQIFMDYIKNPRPFEMIIKVLGPVGDVVEEWVITNAIINHVDFGSLDWFSYTENEKTKIEGPSMTTFKKGGAAPATIKATVVYDCATLKS